MTAREEQPREVRDYTRGFRFPEVVGKLGRWRPFWGIATIPQYVTLVVSAVVLIRWWRIWAHFPPAVNVMIAGGLPALLFVLAGRRAQVDGRPPTSAGLALLVHLLSLLLGLTGGPSGDRRRARLSGWVWMTATRRDHR